MLLNKTIAVIVPSYNEEKQIGLVIETMPGFVDRIVIINDCSKDRTLEIVMGYINNQTISEIMLQNINSDEIKKGKFNRANLVRNEIIKNEDNLYNKCDVINRDYEKDRIILINHHKNYGKGAGIISGYKWCRDHNIDCIATMDGDGQMDPDELEQICLPVINEKVDYVKGNRLIHRSAWLVIPRIRFFGNSLLSILTKIASGYWHVSDTQTGYTAISKKALNSISIYNIYPRYGYPNDMLVKLNISFCTIKEVEIKPVYNVGEESKMKILKVIPQVSWLLFKSFFKRLWIKYLFRDFHPLFLLYHFAMLLGLIWLPYLYRVIHSLILGLNMSFETLFAFSFLGITSFQSFLFAMWMDIQDNERLYKN